VRGGMGQVGTSYWMRVKEVVFDGLILEMVSIGRRHESTHGHGVLLVWITLSAVSVTIHNA
jgi:hypothetical protein